MYVANYDKPGCFGFAATFSNDGVCKTCNAAEACQENASEAVRMMQERQVQAASLFAEHRLFRASRSKETASLAVHLSVPTPKRAPKIVSLTEEQQKLVDQAPVKVRPELRKIMERGIPFRAELESGVNPIRNSGGRPAYLEFTCDLLLKGRFDRKTLRDALSERFGWTYGTVNSHVTIIATLLPMLGIEENNGSFAL
jgi:hypothetical protein